jgi:hypothetical protein
MTTEPTPATDITEKPAAPTITPVAEPQLAAAPSAPAKPSPWPLRFDVVILVLLLVLSFFLASFTASNSDLWMHRAVGKLMSEGKFTFGVDPFSWATEKSADRPAVYWVNHSWLFSWLVYHLINLVGGSGLVIGKAALFTATIALLSRIGWNAANRWFVLFCLVMAALATAQRLWLQPVVVSFLFLALTLFILFHVGMFATQQAEAAPNRVRWLWALPVLFAVWANLDSWFILGPIILGACWAGSGLAKWYPNGNPVPGKTIGLVLGVSLLACLVNPHHVHVFELPPELAYIVVSATDRVGLPMPDALVAGGRTLKELEKADIGLWTVSTLSSQYWGTSRLGLNIAGFAIYFLLVLGLVSFTLTALTKPQPKAPTLQVNRFLLWLVFGVLALMLYRLIPFFALVAAPLTAMTLGEFLLWQQDCNAVSQEKRDRGLHLARLTSVPFMLLLLILAWPGSLTGPISFDTYSSRRVAWDMNADASMREAAETLHELKKNGECQNVFNGSIEVANYLPWYAPDVKFFMDSRFSLYARDVASFVKARQALIDPKKPEEDWRTLFEQRQIDQIVMDNPLIGDPQAGVPFRVQKWWRESAQWRQRYGDNRITVFSWAGPGKSWDGDTARIDQNHLAFGPIPVDQRPPAKGIEVPQPLSWQTLYLDGPGLTPVGVYQSRLLKYYFIHESAQQANSRQVKQVFASIIAAMVGDQALHGGVASLTPLLMVTPEPNSGPKTAPAPKTPRAKMWVTPSYYLPHFDFGPPALPVLMVRAARQAVAENPTDAAALRTLREANQMLREMQEDYWIGYQRGSRFPHPSTLRDRLRQAQLVASAYQIVQLQPEDFEQQLFLAERYRQANLLDLALDHALLAEKALEKRFAEGGKDIPKDPKDRDRILKGLRDQLITPLDEAVRVRLAKLKDKTDLKPLEQAAFAFAGPFDDVRGNDRVRMPMGLGKKALDILVTMDATALDPGQDAARLRLFFELLMEMGRIDIMSAELNRAVVRERLPEFLLAQYQLCSAGVLGNYEAMDEALTVIEKAIRAEMKPTPEALIIKRLEAIPARFIVPTLGWPTMATTVAVTQHYYRSIDQLFSKLEFSALQYNSLLNTMTLRGIMALEAGDTKRAREIFDATLKEAGSEHFFSDRRIAQRYLDLLNENKRQGPSR